MDGELSTHGQDCVDVEYVWQRSLFGQHFKGLRTRHEEKTASQ